MEGLQHIICIHLFLKWYMFFKYCICVTNDIWFYTFKSYQRLGEAAKWNTNVDKGHPLIFYHDPGKHTEGSVTMYHQVGSKGFMKALSASFRSYRQRLIFLMLKHRSFLRGWRPFSVASISGNQHSQCPWNSGLQIGWCRRLRPGRIYGFWCFCHVFDWRMEVNKNTSKWSCALGTGVDGLWAWGSCRCRKAWLRRYATGSSSEFARSPVK